jgi:peptidoglycan/xylan/chitin deacetylase (PgdA/CDA1 family)
MSARLGGAVTMTAERKGVLLKAASLAAGLLVISSLTLGARLVARQSPASAATPVSLSPVADTAPAPQAAPPPQAAPDPQAPLPIQGAARSGGPSRGSRQPQIEVVDPGPVPVLMYHEIAVGPNTLYLPPDQFGDQLDALKGAGFTAITLQEMHLHLTRGKPLPRHPVVLTFDDGYTSFYTVAFPQLKKHGYPGTLFVITDAVGQRGFVTWDEIKEMSVGGMEIGAHTVNHLDLSTLSGEKLRFEIAESRKALEAQINRPVLFFAYPAGRYNDKTLEAVREAGFLGAVTTKYGPAAPDQDTREWKRLRISPGLTGKGLVNMLLSLEPKEPPVIRYEPAPAEPY